MCDNGESCVNRVKEDVDDQAGLGGEGQTAAQASVIEYLTRKTSLVEDYSRDPNTGQLIFENIQNIVLFVCSSGA